MSYQKLLERLYGLRRAGVVLGLERVQACLAALGQPQDQAPVRVHVGGTNGKGSTCVFVESVARACGRHTGLFTSPHLLHFCERFRIAGEPVSEAAAVAAGEAVARAGGDRLTFFEQTTAMAMWLFAEAGVDVAIYEVGLGGRLDATNVVSAQVAAVTGVALDHQEYLGHTLDVIAGEKAGIFKPGQRVVIGRAGEPEAVSGLVARARAAGVAAVTVMDRPVPPDWELGLSGPYQRDNAATAGAVLDHLRTLSLLDAGEPERRRGFLQARFPGRFDMVLPGAARLPRVLVDGAHNPHAARVLAESVAELPGPRVLVLAMSADKDVAATVEPLCRVVSAVIVTRTRSPRALPASELLQVVARVAPGMLCREAATSAEAVEQAFELARHRGWPVVIVAGSLFLAGEVRGHLCGDLADPIFVSDPVGRGQDAP